MADPDDIVATVLEYRDPDLTPRVRRLRPEPVHDQSDPFEESRAKALAPRHAAEGLSGDMGGQVPTIAFHGQPAPWTRAARRRRLASWARTAASNSSSLTVGIPTIRRGAKSGAGGGLSGTGRATGSTRW